MGPGGVSRNGNRKVRELCGPEGARRSIAVTSGTVSLEIWRSPRLAPEERVLRAWIYKETGANLERLCRGCGKAVQGRSINWAKCDVDIATNRLVEVPRTGRVAGHTAEAIAKETATHRRHRQERAAWNPAKQLSWLTEQVFSEKIKPALGQASASAIAKRIGVSRLVCGSDSRGLSPTSTALAGVWRNWLEYRPGNNDSF
jgi:hypothetical protein